MVLMTTDDVIDWCVCQAFSQKANKRNKAGAGNQRQVILPCRFPYQDSVLKKLYFSSAFVCLHLNALYALRGSSAMHLARRFPLTKNARSAPSCKAFCRREDLLICWFLLGAGTFTWY